MKPSVLDHLTGEDSQAVAKAPESTYTFPSSGFRFGEGAPEKPFPIVDQAGGLAVVRDPMVTRQYQIVHKDSGRRVLLGTKETMVSCLPRLLKIEPDWSGKHLDLDWLKAVQPQIHQIMRETGQSVAGLENV